MLKKWMTPLALLGLLMTAPAIQAETLEEIVAWVNDDIITKTELEEQEKAMVAEAYRTKTGAELDDAVKQIRSAVLIQAIDTKILVDRAGQFYDLDMMSENYFDGFMEQNGYTERSEFLAQLESEGMTERAFKQRLVEMFAPEQVVRFEVTDRISVGDRAIDAYYAENPIAFTEPATAIVRELVLLAETPESRAARKSEALAAIERAKQEGFEAVAKELSEAGTKSKGGLLGEIKKGDLSAAIDAAAFEVAVGEISEPIETAYGWHIIMVESRVEERLMGLEDSRESIRQILLQARYEDDLQKFLTRLREEAEWCVKPAYRTRLNFEPPECKIL